MIDFALNTIEISLEEVDNIHLEDIPAFKFAYSGAMGEAGAIDFLSIKDDMFYHHINYAYGNQEVVDKVFSGFFKPFVDVMNRSCLGFMEDLDGWEKYALGFGNFLYLRKEYVKRFKKIAKAYNKNIFKSYSFFYNSVDLLLLMCFNVSNDK